MIAEIARWGDGVALLIPSHLARALAVEHGRSVELTVEGDRLIVSPVGSAPPSDLDAMLDRITPENLHAESDFGAPRDREAF